MLGGATFTSADLTDGDERRMYPRFAPDNVRRNAAALEPVRRIARAHNATPAQVALAWLLHQTRLHGLPVIPIPGTRKPRRVAENLAALDLRLTEDELAALDPVAGQVHGDRLPELPPELKAFMPEVA